MGDPHRRNWEMVTGLVAVVVGVLALLVSAYTAFLQRRQAAAAVWPHLEVDTSNHPRFKIHLANKGVGPALIKTVQLRLDGKPMHHWSALLAGQGPEGQGWIKSTISHRVVAVGEQIDAFLPSEKASIELLESAFARVSGTLCYCSVFDECFTFRVDDDATEQVPACPKSGPGEQFDD
jgi:hypothetical protein